MNFLPVSVLGVLVLIAYRLFRVSIPLSFFVVAYAAAQSVETANTIPRINAAIEIDAELREQEWQGAKKVELAFDTWPAENSSAPVRTQAYLMENGDYFYIAFIAQDADPQAIRAYYRDRDKIWDDDAVGIKIDTYGDHKLAYQFYANPLGVQSTRTHQPLLDLPAANPARFFRCERG